MTDPVPSVLKVGGSVLRTPEAYAAVAARLVDETATTPSWIVVSAAAGVTDRIARWRGSEPVGSAVESLLGQHERLLGGPLPTELRDELIDAARGSTDGPSERLWTWGERASVAILGERVARLGRPLETVELLWEDVPRPRGSALVPGFYLRRRDGGLRLLPRGGGDISAALVAAGLGARSVRFWKNGGGLRLEGRPVPTIEFSDLFPRLVDPIRPIHVTALRIAERLGIELRLEDPFGTGPTTIIGGPSPSPDGPTHRTRPREILQQLGLESGPTRPHLPIPT